MTVLKLNAQISGVVITNENDDTLVSGSSSNDSILNYGSNSTVRAFGGKDTVENFGFYSVIYGGNGNDTITNTSENSTINGGAGNDSITNSENTEAVIFAGAGNDYIFNSHAYYPSLDGGDGNDKIVVTRGHYIYIDGGAGNDTILGENNGDSGNWSMGGYATIQGGDGNDYINPIYSDSSSIQGGEGDDTIINEGHNATLIGGAGDDVVSLHGASIEGSVIQYADGDGNDIIYGFTENSSIHITAGEEYSLDDSGDDVILKIGENEITIVGGKNLSTINVVNYEITPLNISNKTNDTLITGTELEDTIENSGSNVTINSAQGTDWIESSGEYSSINGGADNDTITNSGENSKIFGDTGDDDLYNTGENVFIDGGYGNDWIENGGSNVTINPGAGYDSISVYGNNVVINYSGGSDTIKGFNSTTKLNISGSFSKSDITEDSNNVYISHDGYTLLLEDVKLTADKLNINGKTIELEQESNVIQLTDDGEKISVGRNNVSILGGTGNDTINMLGSNSTIDGGEGENLITLDSDAENNLIYFNGLTTVEGFKTGFGDGSDTIYVGNNSPGVDFKTDGLTFYLENNVENSDGTSATEITGSVTLKDVNSTAKVILAYENGDVNNSVFVADDETYKVSDGEAKYYVGATANKTHGISFEGIADAIDVTLNTDYDATDVKFWINNIHSITGGDSSSKITGSDENDTITGGKGSNTLIGGLGNDFLTANGETEFYFAAGDGQDTIKNFGSNSDKIFVDDSVSSVTQDKNNIKIEINKNYGITLQDMAGNNFEIDVNGNKFIANVAEKNLIYNGSANYYNATGKDATIRTASDVNNANIWLNQEVGANFGNTTQIFGNIKYINGSKSDGRNILVGSKNIDNVITAGKGSNTLWGGGISDDSLIGGTGIDTFFYMRGNGDDTIKGASSNDIVELNGMALSDISSIDIGSNSVTLNFTDNGSLYLNTNSGTNFRVEGKTFVYDRSSGSWQQK